MARTARRIAVTVVAIEGAVVIVTALYMLAYLALELGHLGPCSTFNVDTPCGFADRLPLHALLVAAVFTVALALLWAAWRLLRWSRVAWVIATLAQLAALAIVAGSRDKFSAFEAPFLMALFAAALGLIGLGLCCASTFGARSTRPKSL